MQRKTETPKNKRVGISKKTRFSIFKRDKFTCQYCGVKAPEAILHVDHINPVALGGDNSELNLITACASCNQGKGKEKLSDISAIQKQREELAILADRREQLDMLLTWRKELSSIESDEVEAVSELFRQHAVGVELSSAGKSGFAKLIKKYGLPVVMEAMEQAIEKTIIFDEDGNATHDSVERCIQTTKKLCHISNFPENERELRYIRGICNNRFNYTNMNLCIAMLREANELGVDTEYLKEVALNATNWTNWKETMQWIREKRIRGEQI